MKRPHRVFLAGGNGLQTQTEAGLNAGCGLIHIPEIKIEKSKYTDIDGSYGPMLSLYDNGIPGFTYRKAENIRDVDFCRIQIIAAGVITDWTNFQTKSGTSFGSLARVLPIIRLDRELYDYNRKAFHHTRLNSVESKRY